MIRKVRLNTRALWKLAMKVLMGLVSLDDAKRALGNQYSEWQNNFYGPMKLLQQRGQLLNQQALVLQKESTLSSLFVDSKKTLEELLALQNDYKNWYRNIEKKVGKQAMNDAWYAIQVSKLYDEVELEWRHSAGVDYLNGDMTIFFHTPVYNSPEPDKNSGNTALYEYRQILLDELLDWDDVISTEIKSTDFKAKAYLRYLLEDYGYKKEYYRSKIPKVASIAYSTKKQLEQCQTELNNIKADLETNESNMLAATLLGLW